MNAVIYAAAAVVIGLAGCYLVPDLWRAGQAQVRVWLTPDRPKVVSIETRRRQQLDAAAGRRA